MTFRPFRTSAIALGVLLLGALAMVIYGPGTGSEMLDGTILGIIFTGFITSVMKLSDDGGETDVIKAVKMFIGYLKHRDTVEEIEVEEIDDKNDK